MLADATEVFSMEKREGKNCCRESLDYNHSIGIGSSDDFIILDVILQKKEQLTEIVPVRKSTHYYL
jgi:hypothetical protein